MQFKKCTRCDEVLPISGYYRKGASSDGYRSICKTCFNADVARYRNTPGGRRMLKRSDAKRRVHSTEGNLVTRLNARLRSALGGISSSETSKDLFGMHPLDLLAYLNDNEDRYEYGTPGIQVDHIVPCAAFKKYGDLSDPFFQKAMCNYRNLQLLPSSVNASKGGKCDWETFYAYITEFRAATGLQPM